MDTGGAATLAVRMQGTVLPLSAALGYATQIAAELRELHVQGLAHGAVTPDLVRIAQSEARLDPPPAGFGRSSRTDDIKAYGELIHSMLTSEEAPEPSASSPVHARKGRGGIRQAALAHATRCREGLLDAQRAVTEIRLLAILERQDRARFAVATPARRPVVDVSAAVSGEPAAHWNAGRSWEPRWQTGEPRPEPAPRGVECPICGSAYVFQSRARGILEVVLTRFGKRVYRCPSCLSRYFVVFGHRFARRCVD